MYGLMQQDERNALDYLADEGVGSLVGQILIASARGTADATQRAAESDRQLTVEMLEPLVKFWEAMDADMTMSRKAGYIVDRYASAAMFAREWLDRNAST